MVFDRGWFVKHQKPLLWFANTGLGRRVLCIDGSKSSVGRNRILRIEPNAIFWRGVGDKEIVAEFRQEDRFSRRLYYSFLPLWKAIHLWDVRFSNLFIPNFNLGFDTLTVYPDPNVEVSTVDGQVGNVSEDTTLSNVITGTGDYSVDSDATLLAGWVRSSTTSNQYAQVIRGVYLFDTSALTAGATITAATFSLFGVSRSNSLSGEASANSVLHVVATIPAANTSLTGTDYGTFEGTSFGAGPQQDAWSDTAYNDITINATGQAAISKTGITKFGTRIGWDFSNTTTGLTWASNSPQGYTVIAADTALQTTDPKLVVTYTPASGATAPSYRNLLHVGF